MIRAWQASRRACSAVIRSPVEVVATPIPVSRVSRSRVTITLSGGAAVDREAGVGDVLQERHERLATPPGDRQRVDLTEWACGVGRCRRPGRSAAGWRRGRGLSRAGRWTRHRGAGTYSRVAAWARVSSASSRWYSASSAISGARCSRTPRPRWRSSRGPNDRGLLDQVGLGLHDQVVTQLLGQRLQRLDDHPGLGQVQVAGTQRVGGLRPLRPERRSQRRVPAYGPVVVPGLGRQPRRGGPVTGRLGDVVGGSEHPEPLGLRAA